MPAAMLFEVVERVGRGEDARLKLTGLGLRLALPGTPEEERASKAAALKRAELYLKLLEQFSGHPLPEKDVLKRLLQRDYKIVESMAGGAAEAFLESVKVAEMVSADGKLSPSEGANGDRNPDKNKGDTLPPAREDGLQIQIVKVPKDFVVYQCKISGGRIIQVPLPPKFTKVDVKKMAAFLATQTDDDESIDLPSGEG